MCEQFDRDLLATRKPPTGLAGEGQPSRIVGFCTAASRHVQFSPSSPSGNRTRNSSMYIHLNP